uniref:Methyl-CpG binding domain protein 3b n=1 Tax=Scleropages formosus TaxID=113540 RepID=A0A8C9WI17_SCLFO
SSSPLFLQKGACVWVPDPEAVWVSAQLLQDFKPGDGLLLLKLGDVQHPVSVPSDLPPLGNPDILEGENDLTSLSFLHEPAVLHNLRVRFLDYNSIYTYCGIVLVAINPYEQLPIYGEEVVDAYSGQDMADMEPHIFSVAEEAYRTMIREKKNQSIIISGESGSGKTVSAKFTMRYFAVVGGASQQTSVEERVLATNPIMEAIGNAKTTRNDNSSRFGKYIEIGFGHQGNIIGANMRTYLLEKSRVVFQAQEERNYHIFYQLCASCDLPEMKGLKLDAAEQFRYTNQGGRTWIPGTEDALELERVRNAFTVLGKGSVRPPPSRSISHTWPHGGAVSHLSRAGLCVSLQGEDLSLLLFSKLLGVERAQMAHWLCHRRLAVAGETLVKPMSGQQASEARDALAKHVYGQLFSWTVGQLNAALRAQRGAPVSFIGVLDIYGFETFDRNSFEQFCINYANEKLQQQFNLHVFQLEQEEYVREGLPWSRIEFSDNQPCIALIEGPLGLLDLLDEECRMPKGSDESWARKLYDQHLNHHPSPHFSKPRMSSTAFIVSHFADTVQYECVGFLDKNRDTVFEEPINILRASQSELVAELFQQDPAGGALSLSGLNSSIPNGSLRSGKRAHREHKLTVGFQFRQSLQLLMDTLNATNPHYVRCIKPNDLKQAFVFDPKRAVQQLRACGVLETIRISAAGYPSRWTYPEFFERYWLLLRRSLEEEDLQSTCQRALADLIPEPDRYRFGKTKVFFRAGQVALLERLRAERLRGAAVVIQSRVRGWLARVRYRRTCWAALTLQRYARGGLARRLAHVLRRNRAAVLLQKTFRMVVVRRLYALIREAAVTIQAFTRGTLARRRYRKLVAERAAVRLQAGVRGWLARRTYRRLRAAVLLLQCCVRRRAARRELQRLRVEARSVERYRELNKGMEVKLMQLQLRADQQARETAALREALLTEREAHGLEVARLQGALSKVEAQLREKPPVAPVELERDREERRRAEERAAQEMSRLAQVKQVAVCVAKAAEGLQGDLEEERRRYQGLLRDFSRLEQRYENLCEMNALTEVCECQLLQGYTDVSPLARFLESQLTSQRAQWEEEMSALRSEVRRPREVLVTPAAALGSEPQESLGSLLSENVVRRLERRALLGWERTDRSPTPVSCSSELRVDCALSLTPGLPACVLFLCVRQADCVGDRDRARSLCIAAVGGIKGALKKHSNDVDVTALWLKNTCVLKDLLTQHSTLQVRHACLLCVCARQRSLSDLSIQAYQQLLSVTEGRLQPVIVPALLESETIPGLTGFGGKLSRKRAGSDTKPGGATEPVTMATVLRELGALHTAMSRQALPPTLLEQAFHQLTYLLASTALNNLLLRKDMCCWSRGLQIRYNVSVLEEWLRSRGLQTADTLASLEPLIQAAQLLQVSKKSDADAEALVQTCTVLSNQQIVKVLTLYTPHSDFEERVTLNFIRTVQRLLKERADGQPRQLLLDVHRFFPVTFSYQPPPLLRADQLTIPDSLKVSFLRRV